MKQIGKYLTILIVPMLLAGCFGYNSRNNELIGQVKKVKHRTPILCPERVDVDISLGVLRNGVGSMSSQDIWMKVDDPAFVKVLSDASEKGSLVKVKYDERRITICSPEDLVTSVEIVQ